MTWALDHPIRLRWSLLALAAVIGTVACVVTGHCSARVIGSFLGGLCLVVGAFEFGAFNIRLTARYAPGLTMAVALASYFTTAVALALALIASSPRVVSGVGVAAGLFAGLTIWLATLLGDSWVREPPREPVNIRAQDETISNSRFGG